MELVTGVMMEKELEELLKEGLSDYIKSSYADRVDQALKRLQRTSAPIKTNDDEIEIGDEDIVDSEPAGREEQLKLAHAINFLNQNLKYGQLRHFVMAKVRWAIQDKLKQAISDSSKPSFRTNVELDTLRKQVAVDVSKKIMSSIEKALIAAFPQDPKKFLSNSMKEGVNKHVVNLCEFASKKYIKEECPQFGPKRKVVVRIVK